MPRNLALLLSVFAISCGGGGKTPYPEDTALVPDLLLEQGAPEVPEVQEGPKELSLEVPEVFACTSDEDCKAGSPCRKSWCDPSSKQCLSESYPDGTACEEGPCVRDGVCVAGECKGARVNCNDNNPCTDDYCDLELGCVHKPNTAPCDDTNPCTVGDRCSMGQCKPGKNVCACEKDQDCAAKDDQDLCNGTLRCMGHHCEIDPNTVVHCDLAKDVQCLLAACEPSTGKCVTSAVPDGTPCDDKDRCTIGDVCNAGACVGQVVLVCDDKNPCTDDTCDSAKGCVFVPNEASCDDGNGCTEGDRCTNGKCVGKAMATCGCIKDEDCLAFEDEDRCNGTLVCKAFSCVVDPSSVIVCDTSLDTQCEKTVCDPPTGECRKVQAPPGRPCDDFDMCTLLSACQDGKCQGGGPMLSCDDANPCTADSCDPTKGCVHEPVEGVCNDSNICTDDDHCEAGICRGKAIGCDDLNPCTDDTCDPSSGCVHKNNFRPCDDGNRCTDDDTCLDGYCIGWAVVDCDDQDMCTKDACLPASGCIHTPSTGYCDDGNMCTLKERCSDGQCTGGVEVSCDDDNPCTADECDPAGGCIHKTLADVPCDDHNSCTVGDRCVKGQCVGAGVADCDDGNLCTDDSCDPAKGCAHLFNDRPCDDANPCTSQDHCNLGDCQGALVNCDDNNPCTSDSCDQQFGCMHLPWNEPCEDGNPCTLGDMCQGGRCVPGLLTCDDNNPCTDDGCDPKSGCFNKPNKAPCDDHNLCTLGDHCGDSSCQSGALATCDDLNPCTDDSCDPVAGCKHTPNSKPCDDNDACTIKDACTGGTCKGTPASCNDNNECTFDYCDRAMGCQHVGMATTCNDYNLCTFDDRCTAGKCMGDTGGCDDNNPCTVDSCKPSVGCIHKPVQDLTPCSDGNSCTFFDRCIDGVCKGVGFIDCDDSNPCTDDDCDQMGRCVHTPNYRPCSDNNLCTIGDQCTDGSCRGGEVIVCDDHNPCTTDTCDPALGCRFVPNTNYCDDHNACTLYDTCQNGTCTGQAQATCDDKNPCTTDYCDPAIGCVFEANSLPCDDKDICTTSDICRYGECVGVPVGCDDHNPCTNDGCGVKGCFYVKVSDKPCDDGDVCTVKDKCVAGSCAPGQLIACDDSNPCTTDFCNPLKGCTFIPNSLPCDDGDRCTVGDTCQHGVCVPGGPLACDDANVCTNDSCDPKTGCKHIANRAICEDGNRCTVADTCNLGQCVPGPVRACDDSNQCTADLCDPATGNCLFTPVPDGHLCDDGEVCTQGDTCMAGRCVGGPWQSCDDNNPCTADLCAAHQGCQHQNSVAPCEDGNPCTVEDRCEDGACKPGAVMHCNDGNECTTDLCDPVAGGCRSLPVEDGTPCSDPCAENPICISGVCGGVASCPPLPCMKATCVPGDGCQYTPDDSLACEDGLFCTVRDHCEGGNCVGLARDCADDDQCTEDMCDESSGSCIHEPRAGQPCDDKNPCTTGEVCGPSGEVSCGNGVPKTCDDNNVCTADWCDSVSGQCQHTPIAVPCDDNDACTEGDMCFDGQCKRGKPVVCSDNNPCTSDTCDKALGCRFDIVEDGTPCDDQNRCNGEEKCKAGECAPGIPLDCADDNPCTEDLCDPGTGCDHKPAPDGQPCDDSNGCTLHDSCKAGQCIGQEERQCPPAAQCHKAHCDPATGQCVETHALDGTPCDDSNKCTRKDYCEGGYCVGSDFLNCPPPGTCQVLGGCDPATGACQYLFAPDETPCNDGDLCTLGDVCKAGSCVPGLTVQCPPSQCQEAGQCDSTTGACTYDLMPDGTPCDDGRSCTSDDMCSSGACMGRVACDDNDPCTEDLCGPDGSCQHMDQCAGPY